MTCNTPSNPVVHDQFDEYGPPPLKIEPCNRDCANCEVKKSIEKALNQSSPPD